MSLINVVRVSDPVSPGFVRFRVDRATPLGNPFIIGTHGDRASVIRQYEHWLRTVLYDVSADIGGYRLPRVEYFRQIVDAVRAGESVELACHCSPQACHADVIKRYVLDHANA